MGRLPEEIAYLPDEQDERCGPQLNIADRRYRRCAFNKSCRLAYEPGEIPCFNCPDSWGREGSLSRAENEGKYTEVWSDFSFYIYWPSAAEKQRSNFTLLGE